MPSLGVRSPWEYLWIVRELQSNVNLQIFLEIFHFLSIFFQVGFSGPKCTNQINFLPTSRCAEGEFYSSNDDRCIDCFCMGIPLDSEGTPVQCQSANLPRSLEKVDFYEETLGFSFTNNDFTEEISELQINSRSRELYYDKIQDLEPDVSKKTTNPWDPWGP